MQFTISPTYLYNNTYHGVLANMANKNILNSKEIVGNHYPISHLDFLTHHILI